MSAAISVYHVTLPPGHNGALSLMEMVEGKESAFVTRRLNAVYAYRHAIATARAAIEAIEAEDLDRHLVDWDRQTALDTLADLIAQPLGDREITDEAIDHFWDAQKEWTA